MILSKNIMPSMFTMLNLFFGFFSIVNAFQGKFVTASWLIIFAAVLDAFDGKIARKTHTSSEFGIQFDSLADVVSFGVAPSILIYRVFFDKLGAPGVIISFLPLLFGAIRLARFNVSQDGFEKENYTGLPIPAMACTLSSYVIFNYNLWDGLRFGMVLIPLVLLVSLLMISNIEYEALPKFSFRENKKNSVLFVLVILGIATVLIFKQKVMFPLALGFVLYYVIRSVVHQDKEDEEEVLDVSETNFRI